MDYKVFGCKTNKYFAEKWLVHPYLCDKYGYFIASCVVTDKAKAKWVKHAKKILPHIKNEEKLYLSWCGNIRDGIIDPQFYKIYHELSPFQEIIEILPEDPDDFRVTKEERKIMIESRVRSLKKLAGKELFTRKYMVIQTGCDNFCTFCLTVQARWRHKWREKEEILDEIRDFVNRWGKEVVFTGINLGAWWAKSSNTYRDSRIVELITTVLEETELERLRISSLWVEFCTDELIALFRNPRIIAYVHLSIQSGSIRILTSMNRHYDGIFLREVLSKFKSLKRDDWVQINIWADLIVGFPWETDDDFDATLSLISEYQVTQLHAFAFSAHVDHYSVPAWSFVDQVPNHIAQKRLKLLLDAWKKAFNTFAKWNIWQRFNVLVEKTYKDIPWWFSGSTENYLSTTHENFKLDTWQTPKRGEILHGIFLKADESRVTSDD